MPPPPALNDAKNMEFEIRSMTRADLAAVIAIQHQCYTGAFHEPISAFEAKLSASPDSCWVGVNQGRIDAYLVCLPVAHDQVPALHAPHFERPAAPDWLYVHDLAVGPQGRGTGLAGALLAQALAWASSVGLQSAGLIAVQDAAAFWSRHGFQLAETDPRVPPAKLASFGADARFMTRSLATM